MRQYAYELLSSCPIAFIIVLHKFHAASAAPWKVYTCAQEIAHGQHELHSLFELSA